MSQVQILQGSPTSSSRDRAAVVAATEPRVRQEPHLPDPSNRTDAPPLPDWYDDLAGFEAAAWRLMARGAADRRSPMHTPVLSSIGANGAPRSRVVVLRGVEVAERRLRVHTDARAEKAEQIERDGRANLVFYDKSAKLQVRVDGRAALHRPGSPVADAAWAATRDFGRVTYRVDPPAGTPIAAGDAYGHPERDDEGLANFAVIVLEADAVEALFLAARGHRRALFTRGERQWLVP